MAIPQSIGLLCVLPQMMRLSARLNAHRQSEVSPAGREFPAEEGGEHVGCAGKKDVVGSCLDGLCDIVFALCVGTGDFFSSHIGRRSMSLDEKAGNSGSNEKSVSWRGFPPI